MENYDLERPTIPKDWHEIALGQLVTFQRGHDLPKNNRTTGKYPVVASNGIDGNHNEFKSNGPGVIIGRSGRIGTSQYVEEGYWPLNTTLYSKEFHGSDPKFIYYLVKSMGLEHFNSGSAVPSLNRNYIHPLKILAPKNMGEQRKIGDFLYKLDVKILNLNNQNNILEKMTQTIFKSWFVDYEFPDENGKPYKSSSGEMEYNEEFGIEVPHGWEVKKLSQFINVVKGCSYKSSDLQESTMALVTLKSINRGGGFNQNGYKEYVGKYKENQIVLDKEIIIAQTDLTQKAEVIGRPGIVNSLGRYSKLVASLDLQIVRPKKTVSKNYIYYLLKTDEFHNHALQYVNGTTVLHLNKNAVLEFNTFVPTQKILSKFNKIIDNILNKTIINKKSTQTLSNLRDSLLPKLMSGKICVSTRARKREK